MSALQNQTDNKKDVQSKKDKKSSKDDATTIAIISPTKESCVSTFLEATSNGSALTASLDEEAAGLEAIANRTLKRGEEIIRCPAVCIAIEPKYRRTRCGFCASSLVHQEEESSEPSEDTETTTTSPSAKQNICQACQVISICSKCKSLGAEKWHIESGECHALSCLIRCHTYLFGDNSPKSNDVDATDENENAINPNNVDEVDSCHVLAMRLMCRRWSEQKMKKAVAAQDQQMSKNNGNIQTDKKPSAALTQNGRIEGSRRIVDQQTSSAFLSSPFPSVDWEIFDLLHTTKILDVSAEGNNSSVVSSSASASSPFNKIHHYDAAIEALCSLMRTDFKTTKYKFPNNWDAEEKGIYSFSDSSWITKDTYDDVLGKVMGCGHAITDVTLALGAQCVGRALFLQHSFYNHSCAPNAFFSCHIGEEKQEKAKGIGGGGGHTLARKSSRIKDGEKEDIMPCDQHSCALFAHVHCLDAVEKGKSVALSYIPTSGIDRKERQELLLQGYYFTCKCIACIGVGTDPEATKWERNLKVPDDSDVEVLRQIQYSCNESLINIHELDKKLHLGGSESDERDELLAGCLRMIRMSMNGIKNQDISPFHEVSIEGHRLLASALSLSGETEEAIKEHRKFFNTVSHVSPLIDPMAIAAQRVAFANDLEKDGAIEERKQQLEKAKELSEICLGSCHPFVQQINEKISILDGQSQAKKRRRGNN